MAMATATDATSAGLVPRAESAREGRDADDHQPLVRGGTAGSDPVP